jgi:cytochrome P450
MGKAMIFDPTTLYRQLSDGGPIQKVRLPDGLVGWLVTGYDEARVLLADPRLSKNIKVARGLFPDGDERGGGSPLAEHMLNSDPPGHTRLRRAVQKAFTAGASAQLRPAVERITNDLLHRLGDAGHVDLIDTFISPLPVAVMSELLGIPKNDQRRVRAWSRAFVSRDASRAFQGYLTQLLIAKRVAPGPDLLSELATAPESDERLSQEELINMAYLLLVAGHETTVALIANAILTLLGHPEQLALLRDDRALIPAAVEETLRAESPIHLSTTRFTLEPLVIGGVRIPANESVFVSLLAANRDKQRFPMPDDFDITRNTQGHLAFGHGIHYCLGAPLAKLEAGVALGALLDRFPHIELDGAAADRRWRSSLLIHGPRTLPISYGRPECRP